MLPYQNVTINVYRCLNNNVCQLRYIRKNRQTSIIRHLILEDLQQYWKNESLNSETNSIGIAVVQQQRMFELYVISQFNLILIFYGVFVANVLTEIHELEAVMPDIWQSWCHILDTIAESMFKIYSWITLTYMILYVGTNRRMISQICRTVSQVQPISCQIKMHHSRDQWIVCQFLCLCVMHRTGAAFELSSALHDFASLEVCTW